MASPIGPGGGGYIPPRASTGDEVETGPLQRCTHCGLGLNYCKCNRGGDGTVRQARRPVPQPVPQRSQLRLPETGARPAGNQQGSQSSGRSGGGNGHSGGSIPWRCPNPKCPLHNPANAAKLPLMVKVNHQITELRRLATEMKSRVPFQSPILDKIEAAAKAAEDKFRGMDKKNLAKLQRLASAMDLADARFEAATGWLDDIDKAPAKLKGLLRKRGIQMVKSATLPPWAQPFIKAWEAGTTIGEVAAEAEMLVTTATNLAAGFSRLAVLIASI